MKNTARLFKIILPLPRSRKAIIPLAALLLFGIAGTARPQGTTLSYQGRVVDNGTNFTGTGQFKFALVTSTNQDYITYWSNDGTSSAGSEPAAAVSAPVTDGLFTVLLGDTKLANMTAIDSALFLQPNLQLRIWFNDGISGSAALSPLQNLAAAPYAAFADTASNLNGTLPVSQLSGTVPNSQLANNSVTVNAGIGLSGGGLVALGGATTLNNAGVLLVTGNADITATTVNGAVTLGDTATAANTPSTLIKRDASGNFSAGTVTANLAGNADTVTHGVYDNGTYANPGWITSLAGTKITGDIGGNAAGFIGSLAGDVTGTQGATVVGQIRGTPVSATGPAADQFLRYNGSQWTPGSVALDTDTTGILGDAHLSSNVGLLNGNQAFSGSNRFSGVVQLTNLDNTIAGTFSGSGNSLTGLNPANLSAGTAGINISGNAATATTAGSAGYFTGSLGGDVTGTQGATVVGQIRGTPVSATSPLADQFLRYNGSQWTPSSVGLDTDTTGTLADVRLSANVALRNANQTFTGSNTLNGVVIATNTSNLIVGAFTGNGSGLTSLNGANLAPGTVLGAALQPNAVTSDKIADGTIVNADISATGIDAGKIIGGDLQAARLKVGTGHTLSGAWATIAGGSGSTANGQYATVGGGDSNQALGPGAFVGGGGWDGTTVAGNIASGSASTASGGLGNTASGYVSTVGGGHGNKASDDFATIGGGDNHRAGYHCTVGGGQANTATNSYGTIAGGIANNAGAAATVGGGYENDASGDYATVGGGEGNTAGIGAFVGGGGWDGTNLRGNTASGIGSTIAGGWGNTASDMFSTVAGGDQNTASGFDAVVGGGEGNTASRMSATVPGGENNLAGGYCTFAAGRRAKATHDGAFVWADSFGADFDPYAQPGQQGVNNSFNVRTIGGFYIVTAVDGSGNITGGTYINATSGGWQNLSDRNAKTSFEKVDTSDVLDRVAAMPITEWAYKADPEGTRHIGPTAQDFNEAFRLGTTDGMGDKKYLSSMDVDGVALAAIKGLNQKVEEQAARIQAKDKLISELEQRLERLERLLPAPNSSR